MKKSILIPVSNKTLVEKVQELIDTLNVCGFLYQNKTRSKNQFGFNGETLKQNLLTEWNLHNVVHCDEPAFHCKSVEDEEGLQNTFFMMKTVAEKLPFSMIDMRKTKDQSLGTKHNQTVSEVGGLIKHHFTSLEDTMLVKRMFCHPQSSMGHFQRVQREHKMWWRKISAFPGRYSLTQLVMNDADQSQSVNIEAEFPWGFETIETIKYQSDILTAHFEVKESRKKFIPHVVSSETYLCKSTMILMCDAYEAMNEHTDRRVFRFHRKLAPYKVALAVAATTSDTGEDLYHLALLLARKIRKLGISTLLLPDINKTSLEGQFLRNDAFGVPYTVVLDDKTLQDGAVGIRSRDTTLKEQSHISSLEGYVEKLMKNY